MRTFRGQIIILHSEFFRCIRFCSPDLAFLLSRDRLSFPTQNAFRYANGQARQENGVSDKVVKTLMGALQTLRVPKPSFGSRGIRFSCGHAARCTNSTKFVHTAHEPYSSPHHMALHALATLQFRILDTASKQPTSIELGR